MAARASGATRDARCDFPLAPYDALAVRAMTRTDGDVAARVAVRFDEVLESLRLVRTLVDAMPDGRNPRGNADVPPPHKTGLGYVEGWRGPVLSRSPDLVL